MKGLTEDFIAIDTNIFRHLLKAEGDNGNEHIAHLLSSNMPNSVTQPVELLVDIDDEIEDEYLSQLSIDLDIYNHSPLARIIKYWIYLVKRKQVEVDKTDETWEMVSSIIPKDKLRDQIFVYVAFKSDRILISNDKKDIIRNRYELKSKARALNLYNADVMDSVEAHSKLQLHTKED